MDGGNNLERLVERLERAENRNVVPEPPTHAEYVSINKIVDILENVVDFTKDGDDRINAIAEAENMCDLLRNMMHKQTGMRE